MLNIKQILNFDQILARSDKTFGTDLKHLQVKC